MILLLRLGVTDKFASFLVGNQLVKGLDNPYCMVYGCHCYGQWFGQLGDGRAITVGEVYTGVQLNRALLNSIVSLSIFPHYLTIQLYVVHNATSTEAGIDARGYYSDHLQELQLKGSGRSPFSRGFDGRAVLRSSVREYLGHITVLQVCY